MVGAQPTLEIVAKENKVTILDRDAGNLTEKIVEDPVAVARSISEGWKPKLIADLPDAFCGKIFILMNEYQHYHFRYWVYFIEFGVLFVSRPTRLKWNHEVIAQPVGHPPNTINTFNVFAVNRFSFNLEIQLR